MITLTLTEFLIYMGWACLGQLFSIARQQVKHAPMISQYGGFSLKVWTHENFWRVILTIIAMVLGIVFTEPVLNVPINELTAFFAGAFTDITIEAITNRKKK